MSFSATATFRNRHYSVSGSSDGEAGSRVSLKFEHPDGHDAAGHDAVDSISLFHAATMQAVINQRDATTKPGPDSTLKERLAFSAAMRCFATALTHLETAKMFGIKGLFAYENAGVAGMEKL